VTTVEYLASAPSAWRVLLSAALEDRQASQWSTDGVDWIVFLARLLPLCITHAPICRYTLQSRHSLTAASRRSGNL